MCVCRVNVRRGATAEPGEEKRVAYKEVLALVQQKDEALGVAELGSDSDGAWETDDS